MPAHAFMKLTLFFCAGAIHVETHKDYISEMAGIGKRMPLTMKAFAIAAAGMAGMPLLAGFVSKFYLVIGSIQMSDSELVLGDPTIAGLLFGLALIFSGILNIAYFWPIVYTAFFESEDSHYSKPLVSSVLGGEKDSYSYSWDRVTGFSETTALMLIPIVLVVIGALVLGVLPDYFVFLDLAIKVAESATGLEVTSP